MSHRELRALSPGADRKNLAALCVTQFVGGVALNMVAISLPFYVFRFSPYGQRETLLWVGAIVGLPSFFMAATAPFWGSLTHRFSPKALYIRAIFAYAVMVLLMALTTSLPLLLLIRIALGVFGGASTAGMILATSGLRKEEIAGSMGIYQSSITVGQLVGPPVGTYAAALFGFRNSFLASATLMFATVAFAKMCVANVPRLPKPAKTTGRGRLDRRLVVSLAICLMAQIQLVFLPSVLPSVFWLFKVKEQTALKAAGLVVMLYTATSVLGQLVWTKLSRRFGPVRMITFVLAMSVLFQALLVLTRGIVDFTIVRMVQTGFVAALVPLLLSLFLSNPRGSTIGLLNAARFVGNGVGPLLATSVVAFSGLNSLYLLISAMMFAVFLGFRYVFRGKSSGAPDLTSG